VTGALGTVTASLPANIGTIAELNLAQTWTAQQIINATAAGGGALALLVAPAATANYGTLSIGNGAFDGSTTGHFVGSSSGTHIAVNAASGFGGNLIDVQVAGTSEFSVVNNGNVIANGNLSVSSSSARIAFSTFTYFTSANDAEPGPYVHGGSLSGYFRAYGFGFTDSSSNVQTDTRLTRPSAGEFSFDTTAAGNGLGTIHLTPAGTASGDVSMCWNATSLLATQGSVCGTSLAAYKTEIAPLTHGLDYLMRMNPVTFTWKDDGRQDLGMIADEVAAIDPLLGAYRADSSLYNFRDRPVLAVLVKAMQEIEAQIKTLEAK
jgi:hypothetical protein